MDAEAERKPGKKPRKAEGEAAMAGAEAAANAAWSAALKAEKERRSKMSEEFLKMMAIPLTDDEMRKREEERERLLSETWEMLRDNWLWGPFDAVTKIPCMRFTDVDLHHVTQTRDTLQIVSVEVKELTGGLQWPLDVYGFVAVRDVLDRKRNMVFNLERKDCLTINEQDSCLTLTGPTRGVVMNNDDSHLEVVLKVKGPTEAEDRDLNKFARPYTLGCFKGTIDYTSKLCTVEMQYYTVLLSVEATISVRVFQGQWPHGFRGVLTATTDAEGDIQISLQDLNDDELPVDADGFIKLSRRVVCVEHDGRLGVSLCEHDAGEEGASIWFTAEKSGRMIQHIYVKKFSFWLEVTVAWSLFI